MRFLTKFKKSIIAAATAAFVAAQMLPVTAGAYAPVQYNVTFVNSNDNGQSFMQSVDEGTAALRPAETEIATWTAPDYKEFDDWYTNDACTDLWDFSTLIDGPDVFIYGGWKWIEYTITYELEGGTNNAANPTTYTYDTPSFTIQNPTKAGSEFLRWEKVSAAAGNENLGKEPTIANHSNGDITLQAVWQDAPANITVTFDPDGGKFADNTTANKEVTDAAGAALNAPADPTKDGYDFIGWDPAVPGTIPDRNTTYVAQWQLINIVPADVTVSFIPNGGKFDDNTTDIKQLVGAAGTALNAPADPTRDGYTFDGWDPAVPALFPDQDTRYVAQWTPVNDPNPPRYQIGPNLNPIINGTSGPADNDPPVSRTGPEDEDPPVSRTGPDDEDPPVSRTRPDDDEPDGGRDGDGDTTLPPDDGSGSQSDQPDSGNNGNSNSTENNPHTGIALGGLGLLVSAAAAIAISKKRK